MARPRAKPSLKKRPSKKTPSSATNTSCSPPGWPGLPIRRRNRPRGASAHRTAWNWIKRPTTRSWPAWPTAGTPSRRALRQTRRRNLEAAQAQAQGPQQGRRLRTAPPGTGQRRGLPRSPYPPVPRHARRAQGRPLALGRLTGHRLGRRARVPAAPGTHPPRTDGAD